MPLHNYRCKSGHKFEHLWYHTDTEDGTQPDEIQCEKDLCFEKATPCGGELFARTVGRWGDSLSYYDRGLGCEIKNPAHRDRVMAAKGVEPANSAQLDENMHRVITEHQEHETQVSQFKSLTDSGMDAPDAIDKVFNLDHTTKLNTEL